MIQYIFKRILLFLPTLFLITLLTFCISRLAPGDPAEMKAGVGGESQSANNAINEETIKLIREQWHLDLPLWKQYTLWMNDLAHLNFGVSYTDHRPVLEKILERMPVTAAMGVISLLLIYLIAIPIGIYSAARRYSAIDKITTFTLFVLYSLPSFWIATMAIIFLGGGDYLNWFPAAGLRSIDYSDSWSFMDKFKDYASHLFLPILMTTYGSLAYLSRQMRGSMLEVIRQDYVRTARAKGLSEKTVILKHALRNSLIPIITLLASILPFLVGGSVIIETIFSIPGVGQLAFQALTFRDYPLIMAELVLGSVLTMVGILVADVLYSVVDPRIAFSRKSS